MAENCAPSKEILAVLARTPLDRPRPQQTKKDFFSMITPIFAAPATRAGKLRYVPVDPLLTAAEAAAERGQALSTFWRDVRLGLVPPAYYISKRSPRWRRSELLAALEACRTSVHREESYNAIRRR